MSVSGGKLANPACPQWKNLVQFPMPESHRLK
jgi:hypothetical protein